MLSRAQRQETPEEALARQLSAMNDSVNLINEYIAAAVTSEEDVDTISRNYRHLEIMLAKEDIQSSEADLSVYTSCVDAAKAYIDSLAP
jgi:hypothetical protein